jgi:arsenate reductase-like glutaredoxin family protein
MDAQLKEMKKILEEIASDVESLSEKRGSKPKTVKQERTEKTKYLESIIRSECAEIKNMIKDIDNQTIADSVSKMVVNQLMAPLQEALGSAVKGQIEPRSIGRIAEDMKRKVERLSDRHIRVIKCLSQANGEWVNYDYLSGVCSITQSCLRGYISDLKRVYEIPIESSRKDGRMLLRIDPKTIKRLVLGYQATKIEALDSA